MTDLDETWLTDLLTDTFDSVALPDDGPAAVLAARDRLAHARHVPGRVTEEAGGGGDRRLQAGPDGGRSRTRRHRRLLVVGAAAVVALAIAIGATQTDLGHHRGVSRSTAIGRASTVPPLAGSAKASTPVFKGRNGAVAGTPSSGRAAGSSAAVPSAAGTAVVPVTPVTTPATLPGAVPALPSKVIQTGSISLKVPRSGLQAAVDHVTGLATGLGGFVASSHTDTGGRSFTGQVTVRVPVAQFDQLLAAVKTVGVTVSTSTSGQDVTAADVDLTARIQALQATMAQYLQILAKAESIGDILSVEQQITPVQSEIEQLQGQQQVLEDQATYGTLSVTLTEATAPPVRRSKPPVRSGLSRAWAHARHSFVHGMEAVVSAIGGIAVFLVCALALLLIGAVGWRLVRRRLV